MRGLSLPEVAIALVVFSVLVMGGLGAFSYAHMQVNEINQTKQARDIALSVGDEINPIDFNSSYFPHSMPNIILDGVTYTINLNGQLIGSGERQMWNVEILVTYPHGEYRLNVIKGVK